MKPNPKVDSALHVLKGAVQKVLGAWLTTSVFAEGNKGRLTVEYDGKPTQEQVEEIEMLANQKIAENVPIEMFEMDRSEAEKKFGRIIYDKFPVPPHVKKADHNQNQRLEHKLLSWTAREDDRRDRQDKNSEVESKAKQKGAGNLFCGGIALMGYRIFYDSAVSVTIPRKAIKAKMSAEVTAYEIPKRGWNKLIEHQKHICPIIVVRLAA